MSVLYDEEWDDAFWNLQKTKEQLDYLLKNLKQGPGHEANLGALHYAIDRFKEATDMLQKIGANRHPIMEEN